MIKKKRARRKLTEKQMQILRLIALGFSPKEIAKELELKDKAVEDASCLLHKKLETNNFPSSFAKALKLGLLVNEGAGGYDLPSLSKKEKAIITLISEGVLYKQISLSLEKTSITTVSRYIDVLKERYQVKNVCELIYITHSLV